MNGKNLQFLCYFILFNNRWSHICCPFAKHPADNGILRGNNAHHVNGVGHDDKKASSSKMVNGESDVSHTSKGIYYSEIHVNVLATISFVVKDCWGHLYM